MSTAATWKILEDITIALQKKGVETPRNIINDLRSAKSMMEISQSEKGSGESMQKIQECFDSVEAYVIGKSQEVFGTEYTDALLRRLEESNCFSCQTCQPKKDVENKFIAGVPRDQKWVRVEPIKNLSSEKLRQLAFEQGLSVTAQADGKLLVYGKIEDIKVFVKKMTSSAKC
jgi:hypothetical protein